MFRPIAVMLVGITISAVSVASAASILLTPVLYTGSGENKICDVFNVGTKPVTVDVENVRAVDGTVFASSLNCTLDPGDVGCAAADFGVGPNYCRFRLIKGSKKKIRAVIRIEVGGTDSVVLSAQ
jgi:hypothetical protein